MTRSTDKWTEAHFRSCHEVAAELRKQGFTITHCLYKSIQDVMK